VVEIKEEVAKPCPKCGSEMALRQAKKGKHAGNQFWGCTNFPKCRKVLSL
jgi:ssDNA-binding Zn-finger/Zn-ribbon topoisomerase 1